MDGPRLKCSTADYAHSRIAKKSPRVHVHQPTSPPTELPPNESDAKSTSGDDEESANASPASSSDDVSSTAMQNSKRRITGLKKVKKPPARYRRNSMKKPPPTRRTNHKHQESSAKASQRQTKKRTKKRTAARLQSSVDADDDNNQTEEDAEGAFDKKPAAKPMVVVQPEVQNYFPIHRTHVPAAFDKLPKHIVSTGAHEEWMNLPIPVATTVEEVLSHGESGNPFFLANGAYVGATNPLLACRSCRVHDAAKQLATDGSSAPFKIKNGIMQPQNYGQRHGRNCTHLPWMMNYFEQVSVDIVFCVFIVSHICSEIFFILHFSIVLQCSAIRGQRDVVHQDPSFLANHLERYVHAKSAGEAPDKEAILAFEQFTLAQSIMGNHNGTSEADAIVICDDILIKDEPPSDSNPCILQNDVAITNSILPDPVVRDDEVDVATPNSNLRDPVVRDDEVDKMRDAEELGDIEQVDDDVNVFRTNFSERFPPNLDGATDDATANNGFDVNLEPENVSCINEAEESDKSEPLTNVSRRTRSHRRLHN